MKLDLLSSAIIVDMAVRFVENHRSQHRGLKDQNIEVAIDVSKEHNLGRIIDSYNQQLGITEAKQLELLKGLPFYE